MFKWLVIVVILNYILLYSSLFTNFLNFFLIRKNCDLYMLLPWLSMFSKHDEREIGLGLIKFKIIKYLRGIKYFVTGFVIFHLCCNKFQVKPIPESRNSRACVLSVQTLDRDALRKDRQSGIRLSILRLSIALWVGIFVSVGNRWWGRNEEHEYHTFNYEKIPGLHIE